jgi:hypothetical protein
MSALREAAQRSVQQGDRGTRTVGNLALASTAEPDETHFTKF